MKLIFIGDRFYSESKTMMSSIYDIHGNRQDWGFVSEALENGQSVHIYIHIRPATKSELAHYEKMLEEYKKQASNAAVKPRLNCRIDTAR